MNSQEEGKKGRMNKNNVLFCFSLHLHGFLETWFKDLFLFVMRHRRGSYDQTWYDESQVRFSFESHFAWSKICHKATSDSYCSRWTLTSTSASRSVFRIQQWASWRYRKRCLFTIQGRWCTQLLTNPNVLTSPSGGKWEVQEIKEKNKKKTKSKLWSPSMDLDLNTVTGHTEFKMNESNLYTWNQTCGYEGYAVGDITQVRPAWKTTSTLTWI